MDSAVYWLKDYVLTWSNIIFAMIWMAVGSVLTFIFKHGLAYLRFPKIHFCPYESNPIEVIFKEMMVKNDPGTKNQFLCLVVKNVCWEQGKFGKFIPKMKVTRTRKAEKCYFYIDFVDQNGNPVCKEPMLARINDPNYLKKLRFEIPWVLDRRQDIYPNQVYLIDLVIRLQGSKDCYGLWHSSPYSCPDSVLTNNSLVANGEDYWRKTDELWRLKSGVYKIIIKAYSEGQMLKQDFFELTNLPHQFDVVRTEKFKPQKRLNSA